MPQGGIDPGEDPAQAALRELEEETGMRSVAILAESRTWLTYDLPEPLRPRAWGGRYRGQKQKWFAVRFTGHETEIVTARPPGHQVEFDAWRWAAIAELVDLVVPFKRAVYEEVVREFAPLAAPARGE
jgi:putative (di)nucleoside polyphosphate hydrolase